MDQTVASKKVLEESQIEQFPYEFEFEGLHIQVDQGVFSPKYFNGWRTFTLHFPDFKGKTILEVGAGTGITALYLAKHGAKNVVALDINSAAVVNTQTNINKNSLDNIKVRQSDIFSALKEEEKFDIIYWNMPFMYARESYQYASDLERGLFDPGYKITDMFLKEAPAHLNFEGSILVGTADFGDISKFKNLAEKYNYKYNLIAQENSTELNPVNFQLYELKTI